VIGVGIFTTPGIVAQMLPHSVAILSVWAAGGVLAFIGASAYAELAIRRPQSGGEYVYLREAFGPFAGFLTGWTSFVAGFSGAIAAGAVGLAAYLGRFIPAAGSTKPLFSLRFYVVNIGISPAKLVAVGAIFALAWVHIHGLGPGRLLQNSLAGIKVLALLALIAFGLGLGAGSMENLKAVEQIHPANWLLAFIPVLFTYSGWNAAAYVAEEVRNPAHNLPLALLLGTGATAGLYLLLNFLYLYALPPARLAGLVRGGDEVAQGLFGPGVARLITAVMLVALASSLSAMTLAGPRVYYAMARDGLFLSAAAAVHPRYHTPARSILAQAIWSGILVLSGTFEQLLIYTGFAIVLFGGAAVLSLFCLRRFDMRAPDESPPNPERPAFKAWGYPVAPAIFVLVCLAVVVNGLWRSPGPTLAGLLIITAGTPIYFWSKRRAAP
jgi:APA family basic amino acid/polyamine antiporter